MKAKRKKVYKRLIHERPLIIREVAYLPNGKIEHIVEWSDLDLRHSDNNRFWDYIRRKNSGFSLHFKGEDVGFLRKVTVRRGVHYPVATIQGSLPLLAVG